MVVMERLVAFLMLCGLGILITAAFVGGIASRPRNGTQPAFFPASGFCAGLYRSSSPLSSTRPCSRWFTAGCKRSPLHCGTPSAALVAAAVWEIGRQILSAFLIGTKYTNAYGVVGSFIGLMLWCYYGVAVLLLGAEYIQVTTSPDSPKAERAVAKPV